MLTEVGNFKRFASAKHFTSYIGLTLGEDSSGNDQNLDILVFGNRLSGKTDMKYKLLY